MTPDDDVISRKAAIEALREARLGPDWTPIDHWTPAATYNAGVTDCVFLVQDLPAAAPVAPSPPNEILELLEGLFESAREAHADIEARPETQERREWRMRGIADCIEIVKSASPVTQLTRESET